MNRLVSLALALAVGTMAVAVGAGGEAPKGSGGTPISEPAISSTVYQVTHSLRVTDIPAGSKNARVWFWLPDDDDCQKVLDLDVTDAPAGYKITRDALNGHRYLYAEFDKPLQAVTVGTAFRFRRTSVSIAVDPQKAGELTDRQRIAFAEYLRRDVPNMEVTESLAALANQICGNEKNAVREARLLYDWVAGNTNHYSIPHAPKSSGRGSAEYCLTAKGGGCTDQHALFIAMARARGIPTRLQFGSLLKVPNEGKEIDPGYRCWVQYFIPNYGWVPMDISAGNVNPQKRDFYFSGLDDRRIRFLEGRDLELSPKQDGPRLNLMISAYVEVDGKPHSAFTRILRFNEMRP
jgi:transglutaminase-like putative cysteine protease